MNTSFSQPPIHRSGREGIALIIVLGLLAVLVVLGVSFSISMRTERMATRSYLDVVRARHLTHAALNRVMDIHLNSELQDRVYPARDAFGSSNGDSVRTNLLGSGSTTSAAVFVSGSLRGAAFGADGVNWLELTDPVSGQFYGEYAYLIVNSSGLLDANVIGGRETEPNPRQLGTNTAEIRFSRDILDEIYQDNGRNLVSYRNEFRQFESVPELYYLLSTTDFESNLGERPLKQIVGTTRAPWADSLHVFSRFPLGYADNLLNAQEPVFIGGNPSSWDLGAMKTAIADLEGPSQIPNLDHFISALYDYADPGYISYPLSGPENEQFERFSAKPVPMVNEVIVSNTLRLVDNGGQQQLEHRTYITIETWFPFPDDPDNAQFSVVMDQPPTVTAPPFTDAAQLESGPNPPQFGPNNGNGFDLTTFSYVHRLNVNGQGQPTYTPGGVFRSRVVIPGNIRVTYGSPAASVDVVFGPWGNGDFFLSGSRPALTVGGGAVRVAALAKGVNDPRINWSPGDTEQWGSGNATPTPGARNDARISHGENKTDEFDFMYARRGSIQSVGELGFLLYNEDKPWQTIRLIGETPVVGGRLLDRFTTFTEKIRRGLVNVNTRQTNALASTIFTMPLDRYPGGSTGQTLSNPNAAKAIAQHLIDRIAAQGAITNLSGLSERLEESAVDAQLNSTGDKFLRESLIRNSIGLWGTRHQLFTVFLAARTFSDIYIDARSNNRTVPGNKIDYVTGQQHAIAVIWRDPFITKDGEGIDTHESYVQFFHWFTGAFGE